MAFIDAKAAGAGLTAGPTAYRQTLTSTWRGLGGSLLVPCAATLAAFFCALVTLAGAVRRGRWRQRPGRRRMLSAAKEAISARFMCSNLRQVKARSEPAAAITAALSQSRCHGN